MYSRLVVQSVIIIDFVMYVPSYVSFELCYVNRLPSRLVLKKLPRHNLDFYPNNFISTFPVSNFPRRPPLPPVSFMLDCSFTCIRIVELRNLFGNSRSLSNRGGKLKARIVGTRVSYDWL